LGFSQTKLKRLKMEESVKKLLEKHGVDKVFIYTKRTPLLQNVYTTCLFINTTTKQIEARGVAICSVGDVYIKGKGKSKAFGRAMKALLNRDNNYRIKTRNRHTFLVRKEMKIKKAEDRVNFRDNILPELKTITKNIKIEDHGTGKLIRFDIPSLYPIQLANKDFKYKSQFRPKPAGAIEVNYINSL